MRAFLIACAAAVVGAIVAAVVLNPMNRRADVAFKTDSVRLPESGSLAGSTRG